MGVLVLLNNCTDQSFEVARSASLRLPGSVRLYDVVMDANASHAGGARRAAMSQQPNPSTAAPSRDYVKSHKVIFCKVRDE